MYRSPRPWVILLLVISAAYFTDLFFQVRSFTGDWGTFQFVTSRTLIPWLVYAIVAALLVSEIGAAIGSSHENGKLSNAGGTLVLLSMIAIALLPYGVLDAQVYSGIHSTNAGTSGCSQQLIDKCQAVRNGTISPAAAFGTNPADMVVGLSACIASCDYVSMKALLESVKADADTQQRLEDFKNKQ